MSVNPTEIRVFGAVSGSDREITLSSTNLRACWWGASRVFCINIAVNLTIFTQGNWATAECRERLK